MARKIPALARPTPHEFNRLQAAVERLSVEVADHRKELGVQLKRIAQLQAEMDLIRAAWVKITPKDAG